ncbi:hypothetical protein TNCV_380091 [Trichonephila clavipes]|nr:hypothetical protein TNCV_380091 [Trichonephila clavipes]
MSHLFCLSNFWKHSPEDRDRKDVEIRCEGVACARPYLQRKQVYRRYMQSKYQGHALHESLESLSSILQAETHKWELEKPEGSCYCRLGYVFFVNRNLSVSLDQVNDRKFCSPVDDASRHKYDGQGNDRGLYEH